jgi:hypothetical protein
LLTLYSFQQRDKSRLGYFSAIIIWRNSGVNYNTLSASLGRWNSWQYIERKEIRKGEGRIKIWGYRLTAKGERYVTLRITNGIMPRKSYLDEMATFQRKLGLLEITFTDRSDKDIIREWNRRKGEVA